MPADVNQEKESAVWSKSRFSQKQQKTALYLFDQCEIPLEKLFFIKLPLLSIAGLTSSNPLLEFCLDGGISRKETSPSEKPDDLTKVTSLLSQCSTCSDWLASDYSTILDTFNQNLRQTGCDINVQDRQGKTALHHLIKGKPLFLIDLLESELDLNYPFFPFQDVPKITFLSYSPALSSCLTINPI